VTDTATLHKLEQVLESFLDRAVQVKSERLNVLEGINRLDDIARGVEQGYELSDEMGMWFAKHSDWLHTQTLRPAEQNRIKAILGEIRRELKVSEESSPAINKISREIDRWSGRAPEIPAPTPPAAPAEPVQKIVLKRGPETVPPVETDSISLFQNVLTQISSLFGDYARNRAHLLSALDESLRAAEQQNRRDALLLSATIIYYLKQRGYKVEPYVKRLKAAEVAQRGGETHA
jgi:hypothetical protein